jgi:5-methylcytosine-specific restriction endonuclease McrA
MMSERRNFTAKTKGLIRERSGGQCEVHLVPRCMYPALPEACSRPATDFDHITPDWAGGEPTVENGAHLCPVDHKIKTVTDNKEAKKSNRLRGEAGQLKRRAQRGPTIKSRGFDRTLKRRMDGTVTRRDA